MVVWACANDRADPKPQLWELFSGPKQEKVGFKLSCHKANYLHKKMLNDSRSQLQIQANTGKYKQIQAGKTERKCDKEGTVITREEINGGGGSQVAQKDLQMQIRSSEVQMQIQIQI